MSTHPSTQHEIAQLRHEERLVRAALAHAHSKPADSAHVGGNVDGLSRLFGTVRAHFGARRGVTAIRVPRLLS
jgi:hypothetical protein